MHLLGNRFNLHPRISAQTLSVATYLVACGIVSGCAAPLVALGSSSTAVASSAGTAAGTAAVANPVFTAGLASSVTTGKSPLEHATSALTKKECHFFNVLESKPICIEVPAPTIIDRSELYLGPADKKSTAAND
ncbi:hypothetical protein SAMN06295945_1746 [Polynucleobacter meluiroseus]|uniref:Uncharacterized protein n=1 Tax=Polynucleobacter meluiroseus TaxID=1938814 RepID=A0A240E375_9BURK|nr:hypothetical protein [Polynucleobacter meluiroseus]SNX29374.1 hypothetical protein SAMN06295945_1746 [Polynucleobacter meluiroseus]